MHLRLLLALLSLTFSASRAVAVEPPVTKVRPGAVATAMVALSAPAADETVNFVIEPTEGVRIWGSLSGRLELTGGAVRRIPVTFTVPNDARAGAMVAATVTVEWVDGRTERQDLLVEVEVVHRLVLSATTSKLVIQPGGTLRVAYQLTNLGNVVDTVHVEVQPGVPWSVSPPSESRLVLPGASLEGQFEVHAPRNVPIGEQRRVQVNATGRGGDQSASVVLLVAEANGGALAQLPVQVFLGASTAGGTNLSVSGRTSIGPHTEVGIAFRHVGSFHGQIFGQTDFWGPRAVLSVRHGSFQGDFGNVSVENDGIASGVMTTGAGVGLRHQGKRLRGGLVLAYPDAGFRGTRDGHLMQGELGYAVAGGTLSARVLDFEGNQSNFLSSARLQLVGLRYELEAPGPHRFFGEAGLVRQDVSGTHERQGASVDATYSYSTRAVSVSAHLRRVPDQLNGTRLLGNEASVSGNAAISPAVWLNASGYWGGRNRVEDRLSEVTLGASTGLQVHAGGSSLGLAWNSRHYHGASGLGGRGKRNAVAASLNTGIGPLSLRTTAEAGIVVRGDAEPYNVRRIQGQLRWIRPSTSAWLSASYTDEQVFRSPVQAEFGTRLRLGEINLDAAVGTNLTEWRPSVAYLHAGAEVYITRALSAVIGTEYRPWNLDGAPYTFSVGFRRALSVPLPLREGARVSGVVFEDRNGNGRKDRGEAGLEGVAVSIGPLRAITGVDGQFAFRHNVPEGLPVQMDVGSLGEGYLALFSETLVPGSGRIAMPVVRAAALEITVFEDRDGDQSRSGSEPALAGAVVLLKSPTGRSYPRSTNTAGTATFVALPPGGYEVYLLRQGIETAAGRIDLAPGEGAAREIGLATGSRPIKMLGGTAIPVQR